MLATLLTVSFVLISVLFFFFGLFRFVLVFFNTVYGFVIALCLQSTRAVRVIRLLACVSVAAAPPGKRRGAHCVVGAHPGLPTRHHPHRLWRCAHCHLPHEEPHVFHPNYEEASGISSQLLRQCGRRSTTAHSYSLSTMRDSACEDMCVHIYILMLLLLLLLARSKRNIFFAVVSQIQFNLQSSCALNYQQSLHPQKSRGK